MNPYVLSILLISLGLGTTVTFMSSHWLLAWMGLEINTLAILPLMAQSHHPRCVEATTKYFLTQATAAAMILFASSVNAWITGLWSITQLSHPLPLAMVTAGLALKIGLAPVHVWLPEVLQGLDLTTGLIMSTWQKLAPFALLTQLSTHNALVLTTMGLLSILVGGWAGLNQTQLRKILAYSSVAHLGWMVLVLQYSPHLTMLTLAMYVIMTFAIFSLFSLNSTTSISMLATASSKFPALTALAPFVMLSLAGLPPLAGFGPKWLILQELTKQQLAPLATVAALSALFSLYFYLRLAYAFTLTLSPNNTPATLIWRHTPSRITLPIALTSSCSLLLLPLLPTMVSLAS